MNSKFNHLNITVIEPSEVELLILSREYFTDNSDHPLKLGNEPDKRSKQTYER